MQIASALRQCGNDTPCSRASFKLSSRELAGRRAGVGYADAGIDFTRANGPPAARDSAKIASANSAQVASPCAVMWKTPRRPDAASVLRLLTTLITPSAMSWALVAA